MYNVAIIGAGKRMKDVVPLILEREDFTLKAICDNDVEAAKERFKEFEGVNFFTDVEEMLESEDFDGVFIGSRCSSHTDYAILCAKKNIPIFLEKPVCVNEEQLKRLEALPKEYDKKVVVSFPLRKSAIVRKVKEIINSGSLGKIQHVQAWNNVFYGRLYYHYWYKDENETGGLFLQKATHDIDYINYLLDDRNPVKLCAMESKQIYKGNMPKNLYCKDCDKRDTCPESDKNVATYGENYDIDYSRFTCAFAEDTGNHDSATAIIMYDDGMHAVYSQDFIVRKGAGKRGARLVGYYGTVEFDFASSTIDVFYHLEDKKEHYDIDANGIHFGGDAHLVNNFADVITGKDVSDSPLSLGILSAKMCMLCKDSAKDNQFKEIK